MAEITPARSLPAAPLPIASAPVLPLWVIVLAAGTIAAIGMGLRQVMGLYMKPITEHLGIGREAFSLAIAVANIVWGIAAPFTGAISDKYGAGKMVLMGATCTAIGLALMDWATSDIHLLLSGLFLGFGVAGAGVNAMVGAVGRAAGPEKRTQAISMLGVGSGLGVFIALPYTHLLIQYIGWQASLLVLAGTALTMLPLAFIVGAKPQPVIGGAKPQTLREALAEAFVHPSFWLLTAGFFVCGFQIAFYSLHLPAYLADKGIGNDVAVLALTMVGIGNLIGTWLAGQSAKYMPNRFGLVLIYLGRCLVFLCFLYIPMTPTLVVVLSFVLGILWLSTVPLTSSLVATFFGPAWMTMLFGVVFMSHQIGSFTGVWLAGRFYDTTHSYDTTWWTAIGMGLFAAAVHWPIKEVGVARLQAKMAPV